MVMVPQEIVRRRLTFKDYKQLPDDADYEIIEGVLYVSPRPRAKHQVTAGRLSAILFRHVDEPGLGAVVPDADLIISDQDVYISPDIMVFLGERAASVPPNDWIRTVPNLVVEVLSPGTQRYDLTTKRRLYAELGVSYYWIVDADGREIIECALEQDGTYRERVTQAPATFTPELLPGLAIDLSRLFA